MHVRVLFFGVLKDLVGQTSDDADFPEATSLGNIFESYAQRFPRLGEMAGSILMARNREFAERTTVAGPEDEVAFLPPVSGGCETGDLEIREAGNYFALTRRPIDTRAWIARPADRRGRRGSDLRRHGPQQHQRAGHLCLDYECYEPMALKTMARIGPRDRRRASMPHRHGAPPGAGADRRDQRGGGGDGPHRRPAFEAAMEAIDRLKKTVPIWKKEHFVDGEVWVEGEWDDNVPLAG